jgi:hypothetical protein
MLRLNGRMVVALGQVLGFQNSFLGFLSEFV